MHTFCTIITSDYAHYALALYDSYRRFTDIPLHVLSIDRVHDIGQEYPLPEHVSLTYLDDLVLDDIGRQIREKYQHVPDALRWSLKSVLLRYLLTTGGYQEGIYVDQDIFFYQDPAFLFDELGKGAILLAPHWRSSDPQKDPFNFELNFRDGIYNGGFLGATQKGLSALDWLASACLFKCEIDFQRGLFYDQKYFDLLYSRFAGMMSLRHQGCNVANWNQIDCRREMVDGQVLINGKDPIVFIHFTKSTMYGIRKGSDSLLLSYLDTYEETLKRFHPGYVPPVWDTIKPQKKHGVLQRIIHKLSSTEKSTRQ